MGAQNQHIVMNETSFDQESLGLPPKSLKVKPFTPVVTHKSVAREGFSARYLLASLKVQSRVLELIAKEADLSAILNTICHLLEQLVSGAYCSILLLDQHTCQLRAGAAPSLHPAFAAAVDGLVIGEGAGSCGTAAYRGEAVFVTDINTDPLWASFRDLALSYGIQACWSIPFFSQQGEVLGTFALSHRVPCRPTATHLNLMKTVAHLASIAVTSDRSRQQLQQYAFYDPLTGLNNRTFFTERVAVALKRNNYATHSLAVLFLDVDEFKRINDSLGHSIGDEVLGELVKRIKPVLGSHLFTRLGGDEFAILLNHLEDAEAAVEVALKICERLKSPINLASTEIFITVSIGIAFAQNDKHQVSSLLQDADMAMYCAKLMTGNAKYCVFDPKMHAEKVRRLQLETDLKTALEHQQFHLYYQPIICLKTGQVESFEVLLRWQHPQWGWISPSEFMPLAEKTGLVVELGEWVLQKSLHQLQQWRKKFPKARPSLAVNLCGRQFQEPDFLKRFNDLCADTQDVLEGLRIEISETVLIEHPQETLQILEQFKQQKIQLCLDRFGIGYSSLSCLHSFPIDTLKIDPSLIGRMGTSQKQLVPTLIALAHHLGIATIAEGIETLTQLTELRKLGCEWGQGSLFSQPLELEAAEILGAGHSPWQVERNN